MLEDKEKSDKEIAMCNKVEALTDFEICKFIADLECLPTYAQFGVLRVMVEDGDDYYFNPLENNDQLVALMVKHDVVRRWEPYDFIGWSYHVLDGENRIHITERQFDTNADGNPNTEERPMSKCVCLAIILNKVKDFSIK